MPRGRRPPGVARQHSAGAHPIGYWAAADPLQTCLDSRIPGPCYQRLKTGKGRALRSPPLRCLVCDGDSALSVPMGYTPKSRSRPRGRRSNRSLRTRFGPVPVRVDALRQTIGGRSVVNCDSPQDRSRGVPLVLSVGATQLKVTVPGAARRSRSVWLIETMLRTHAMTNGRQLKSVVFNEHLHATTHV